MTLKEFANGLQGLRVRAQGVAIREASGKLRDLTEQEMQQLGIRSDHDVSDLIGKEVSIPGTRFKLRLRAR